MKTEQQLKAELKELISKLHDIRTDGKDDEILKLIQQKRDEIDYAERVNFLEQVNREHTRKRELAAQVWECEQPTEDVTTNDGSWHKVKIKKYPKLAALPYGNAKYEDGVLTYIRTNGEKFRVVNYDNKRPDSFDEFLKLNYIMPEPMSIEQYNELDEQLQAAENELENAIKAYSEKMNRIKAHEMKCYGLLSQVCKKLYTIEVRQ
jgi:hypothetical protein